MKIAILTSAILPVPAVYGGAVENLIDYYLEYNKSSKLNDITIYSIDFKSNNRNYNNKFTHYKFIDTSSFWGKIKRKIYGLFHEQYFYNHYIEYYLYKSLKDISNNDYDVIVVENRPGYIIPISRVTNANIVLHLHNDLLNIETKDAYEICKCCSSIITVSNYIRSCVQTIDKNLKISVVHNGIDLQKFYYPKTIINRSLLGFNENNFIVVYNGRINKEKGVKELIQSFKYINNQDIKLLIIGGNFFGNSTNNDNFIEELKDISSNIKDRIKFTGYINYSDIPSYLNICDVAVIPSIWDDPFPTSVIEGMAAGMPLIVTNSGGINEEVTSENAIIIDKNGNVPKQIANSLITLYNDKDLYQKMKIHSLERSKYFNKERYSKLFFEVINNITNQKSCDHQQSENNQ